MPFGLLHNSSQERATKISHGHTALMAKKYGDDPLAQICGAIAADESRHEIAYTRIVDELFRCAAFFAFTFWGDATRGTSWCAQLGTAA